jgi:hypothetical protein
MSAFGGKADMTQTSQNVRPIMTAHRLVEMGLLTAVVLFGYYWIAREE